MTGIDEEWEAAMTALRDLQATASRLCGEAAQDKATAETIYENAIARADGLRAAIEALNCTRRSNNPSLKRPDIPVAPE
jgi:hypothetical protein